jgi:hypothetical protein
MVVALGSKLRLTELTIITCTVNSLYHLYGNPTPWLEQYGFLPTQKTLGSGPQSAQFNQTIPFYNKMITVFPMAHSRPSLAEYPQTAENVRERLMTLIMASSRQSKHQMVLPQNLQRS